jgi:cardiolipin synthase A/B
MGTVGQPLRDGHYVQLLQGGHEFFPALIRAIDHARSDVHLETYIFDFTGVGTDVAQALERAGRRGVAVCLVVDGVGTGPLPVAWQRRFEAAGVQWSVYSPLGTLGLLIPSRWRRLHRKLCVVDGHVAFCGGFNILDDFHDPHHGRLERPRLDFAVRASGTLVREVQETTTRLWWRLQALRNVRQHNFPQAFSSFRAAGLHLPWTDAPMDGGANVRVARAGLLLRDNVRHRTQIERAYLKAIATARQEILIANAYFVPGRRLRKALILAAQRGVRVCLLLHGRYENFMQYHAPRPVYGRLLAAGVEIHEYTESFLHAKVAVIDAAGDHPWATVGSSNLDPLSLLLAREANVVVADGGFARVLRERLLRAIDGGSHRVDPAAFANRPLNERALNLVAFALMRAALFLTGSRY